MHETKLEKFAECVHPYRHAVNRLARLSDSIITDNEIFDLIFADDESDIHDYVPNELITYAGIMIGILDRINTLNENVFELTDDPESCLEYLEENDNHATDSALMELEVDLGNLLMRFTSICIAAESARVGEKRLRYLRYSLDAETKQIHEVARQLQTVKSRYSDLVRLARTSEEFSRERFAK